MVRRTDAFPALQARVTAGATLFTHADSPVGPLLLTANPNTGALTRLQFGKHEPRRNWIEEPAAFAAAAGQLAAYFAGTLTRFTLDLEPSGTTFQLAVWHEMLAIPHGGTMTYGEIARRVGSSGGGEAGGAAARAVGMAAGANPLAIVIPCHRVIGAGGRLTGFGGGLPIKARLLALERGERELGF